MQANTKRLAMAIVEYLDKAVADGSVAGDGAESLEVAKQCISDAFGIDPEDEIQTKELSLKPFSLDKVFDVYLSTQAKLGGPAAQTTNSGPSDSDRKLADEFKAKGNALIVAKDYKGAIDSYTRAIALVNDSAVYFGNRAAAYSQNGDHQEAVDDAKKALDIDPAYSKGYSRLGLAYFGMGNFEEAIAAYKKGLEQDPANKAMQSALESAQAKVASASSTARSAGGTAAAATSAAPGSGGGGFDLGSLMNNPALMNMAQSMMANGGLERLMNNPAVSQLASNYRNTGQMPSMADMMSNPDIMDMARNVGGSSAGNEGANPLAALLNNPDLAGMAQRFMSGSQGNGSDEDNSRSE
ncbi:Small glutamine-rich tetratricopeptide repeat-containing protein 2 [Coemansia aciculifera]|uniref:Small glutamine-rich tetratricopeptide repeat-containing protein 2 n=1 Tax=Coemansia aciculifera TaxID=417176 RepID=A0ACC1M0N4_9FUNG|nr:Small glutamine-rich tetratricopeptide repeat-containing protein 2 [Coemansia aciculifera]KAJ2895433.1 Small glutamine-rich tetratricopeptide repeat-containing protein 2 [Coemansia aciculifera]